MGREGTRESSRRPTLTVPLPRSPRIAGAALVAVALALAATSFGLEVARVELDANVTRLQQWFDVDREATVPTWFTAALFLGGAVAVAASNLRPELRARGWTVLAVVLVVLSLDETVSLHEEIGDQGEELFGDSGLFAAAWVVPGLVFAAVVATLSLRAVRMLPAATQRLVLAGGALFVAGAAGLEVAGIALDDTADRIDRSLPLAAVQTFEELFEMLGLIVFVCAIGSHLSRPSTEPAPAASSVSNPPSRELRDVMLPTA